MKERTVVQIGIEICEMWPVQRRTMGTYAGVIRIDGGEMAQVLQFRYRGDHTITYLTEGILSDPPHVLRVFLDQIIQLEVRNEKQREADKKQKKKADRAAFKKEHIRRRAKIGASEKAHKG